MGNDQPRDPGPGTRDPGAAQAPEGSGRKDLGNPLPSPDPGSRIPDPDLDAAIDIVAREMTALDAPADLRARVLAEIETAAPRHSWWRTPAWATAAAAALLAALIWMWPQPAPKPAQQIAGTPTPVARPASEQPTRTGVPTGTAAIQHIVSNVPQRRPVSGRTVSADVMNSAAAESAEAELESWVVVRMLQDPNPIAINALSVSPVEITTLTIQELRVDPVDPGRDPEKQ